MKLAPLKSVFNALGTIFHCLATQTEAALPFAGPESWIWRCPWHNYLLFITRYEILNCLRISIRPKGAPGSIRRCCQSFAQRGLAFSLLSQILRRCMLLSFGWPTTPGHWFPVCTLNSQALRRLDIWLQEYQTTDVWHLFSDVDTEHELYLDVLW